VNTFEMAQKTKRDINRLTCFSSDDKIALHFGAPLDLSQK